MLFRAITTILERRHPDLAPVDGSRLTRVGPGAWVADRELVYGWGRSLPTRMVVLRVAEESLALYGPLALDDGTLEALSGLGEVRWIIVPNRFHSQFAAGALERFPEARLLLPGADGSLLERFPHRAERVEQPITLGAGTELLPVALRPGFDELVAYHDEAELLVVADLFFNLQSADLRQVAALSRWFLRLNGVRGQPAQPRWHQRLIMKERENLAGFYRWALAKPFSVISMSHGQIINRGARETFYRIFHAYTRRR